MTITKKLQFLKACLLENEMQYHQLPNFQKDYSINFETKFQNQKYVTKKLLQNENSCILSFGKLAYQQS